MFWQSLRSALAVLILSTLCYSQAQTPASPESVAEPEKKDAATIIGKVVRSTDGAPLKKATIFALQTQTVQSGPVHPKSAITDADGKFVLKDLDPGRYSLSCTRTGYARHSHGALVPPGPGAPIML